MLKLFCFCLLIALTVAGSDRNVNSNDTHFSCGKRKESLCGMRSDLTDAKAKITHLSSTLSEYSQRVNRMHEQMKLRKNVIHDMVQDDLEERIPFVVDTLITDLIDNRSRHALQQITPIMLSIINETLTDFTNTFITQIIHQNAQLQEQLTSMKDELTELKTHSSSLSTQVDDLKWNSITKIELISLKALLLTFRAPYEEPPTEVMTNFIVNHKIGNPQWIEIVNSTAIVLHFATSMDPNVGAYLLTIKGFQNLFNSAEAIFYF